MQYLNKAFDNHFTDTAQNERAFYAPHIPPKAGLPSYEKNFFQLFVILLQKR